MNPAQAQQSQPSLDKRAEAAAWLARLRGPERTVEVEQGFQRWLRANEEHRRVFELLSERMEAVERLRIRPVPARWQHKTAGESVRWRLAAGIAAVLLVAAVVMTYSRYSGVTTSVGEQRTLALPDGSRVYLNTDSRVVMHYDEQRRRIDLKHGEALFEVARRPGRPFVVMAGGRQIVALGTSFMVRQDERKTSVILMEGKVAVAPAGTDIKSASGSAAVLSPGERLIFTNTQPQPQRDAPPLDKVTAWRQGQVALEDMPLSQAIVEMNRYSTVKLAVEDPRAANVRVGGFFRMGDSASFARAVGSTYGLQVVERDNEIVLTGVPQERGR